MTYELIITILVILSLVLIVVMAIQNYNLLHNADKRLDRANQMVLKLAESADTLAASVTELKDLCVRIREKDEIYIKEIQKNNDDYKHAYRSLLDKYNEVSAEYKAEIKEGQNTLRELARRQTSNNNIHVD